MDAEPRAFLVVLGGSIVALFLALGVGLWILGIQLENPSFLRPGKKIVKYCGIAIVAIVITWFLLPAGEV